MSQVYKAYAPASIANLNVGFDLLGLALEPLDKNVILGDVVEITPSDNLSIITEGKFAHKLPSDIKLNIVYDAFLEFNSLLAQKGIKSKNFSMILHKNLPLCSGLGSSASSIVASVVALNKAYNNIFDNKTLLKLMGKLEGKISGSVHYDNVAPSFLGSLQLMSDSTNISNTLPVFDNWIIVSCFPGVKVSTNKARALLPKSYDKATSIEFAKNLSNFVYACFSKQSQMALECLVDHIAEPYRQDLIPHFSTTKEQAYSMGAKAFGISGSGSSVFAIFLDKQKAFDFKVYLEKNFIANVDGFCHLCRISEQGAR